MADILTIDATSVVLLCSSMEPVLTEIAAMGRLCKPLITADIYVSC